jgi:hypothetical protein
MSEQGKETQMREWIATDLSNFPTGATGAHP